MNSSNESSTRISGESASFFAYGVGKPSTRNVDEFVFDKRIKKCLDAQRYSKPNQVQHYLMTTIHRGRNVICVSPYSCGKTVGYLLSVLNTLLRNFGEQVPTSNYNTEYGVVFLILVPTWQLAEKVRFLCRLMVNTLQVAVLYGGGERLTNQLQHLAKGCSILIATPLALLRFFDEDSSMNLRRLKHLVVDDADVLLETFGEEFKRILAKITVALMQRRTAGDAQTIQLIACGKRWTKELRNFSFSLQPLLPILMVFPWMEVSSIVKVPTDVVVVAKSEKLARLNELLKNSCGKVAICVSGRKLLEELDRHLVDAPSVFMFDDETANFELDDVEFVVHFDLGKNDENGKSAFERRLALMGRNFDKVLKNRKQADIAIRQVLFVDENNWRQASELVKYQKRRNSPIPQELMRLFSGRSAASYRLRDNYELCPYLKCFGVCPVEFRCSKRHDVMLNGVDRRLAFLHEVGEIRVKVFSAFSAQRLIGRLEGDESFEKTFACLGSKLAEAFERSMSTELDAENVKWRVGDFCIFAYKIDGEIRVYRGKVLRLEERLIDKRVYLKVRSIDEGWTADNVRPAHLTHLPKCLSVKGVFPPMAVEIVLLGVKPLDGELDWSVNVCQAVVNRLKEKSVRVGVRYVVDNVVFADRVVITEKVAGQKMWFTKFDLKNWLVESEAAQVNSKHAELLGVQKELFGLKKVEEKSLGEKVEEMDGDKKKNDEYLAQFILPKQSSAGRLLDGLPPEEVHRCFEVDSNKESGRVGEDGGDDYDVDSSLDDDSNDEALYDY